MISRVAAALSLLPIATSVQAASVTLGCAGTVTTTTVPKVGVAAEPEKENIKDHSIVVDFDRKAVSGFWVEELDKQNYRLLPITAVDAQGVSFSASEKDALRDRSIHGSVNRNTGYVSALSNTVWKAGNTAFTLEIWELHCKRTGPLF
jgi:hypothetical protein